MSGAARLCPGCGRPYPVGSEHELRRGAWLHSLPRGITWSNGDMFFHEGAHGRNRFLLFEVKRLEEPISLGQERLLVGFAKLPETTVRIIAGPLDRVVVRRVFAEGIERQAYFATAEAIRLATVAFLDGSAWRDPIGRNPSIVEAARQIFAEDLV